MTMTEGKGIEVDGLVRDFKGGIRAVDGIELAVAPGEIYGFLGPNGAGKSTTVLMLTTLLPPTAGTARVAGFDIAREEYNLVRPGEEAYSVLPAPLPALELPQVWPFGPLSGPPDAQ